MEPLNCDYEKFYCTKRLPIRFTTPKKIHCYPLELPSSHLKTLRHDPGFRVKIHPTEISLHPRIPTPILARWRLGLGNPLGDLYDPLDFCWLPLGFALKMRLFEI